MTIHECLVCSDVVDPLRDEIVYWHDREAEARYKTTNYDVKLRIPDAYTHRRCADGAIEDRREERPCPRCGYVRKVKVSYVTYLVNGELVRREWLEWAAGRGRNCTACAYEVRARELERQALDFRQRAMVAREKQRR